MFDFLKKKYPNKIQGKIERIGTLPNSEFLLRQEINWLVIFLLFDILYQSKGQIWIRD